MYAQASRFAKCSVSNLTNISYFQQLEVVGRGSEIQLQVGETLNYLIQRFKGSSNKRTI